MAEYGSVLRSKFLHRRARRIGGRFADSVLASFSVLGVEESRQRVRVAERWAFSFMVVVMVRLSFIVALYLFFSAGGFKAVRLVVVDMAKGIGVKAPIFVHDVSKADPLEWYRSILALLFLAALILLCVYAVKPLSPLRLVVGKQVDEADLHRRGLFSLERRGRAALILYGHAAGCARAILARGWVRDCLTSQARSLPRVEREVLHAWKSVRPGQVKIRRHQRVNLKNHAGRVVAALRAQSERVDADPENALRDLGCMLVRIGDRLAEGRVGALLDEAELEGLDPVRDHDVLTTIAAATGVALAAIFVAAFRLPAELATPLTTALGITILVTLYRKAGGAETVSLLLGGK
ncbi:hypothetical protein [Streptomyces sp. NPDC102487]|uniref:hypothetical protein n=1 Tax=Streptomyces sp. NPDC102487 TaxID=3366182 RepID=UPI0038103296